MLLVYSMDPLCTQDAALSLKNATQSKLLFPSYSHVTDHSEGWRETKKEKREKGRKKERG